MRVVLSGPVQCGKSTVVAALLDKLGCPQPAGFKTVRSFMDGVHNGFLLQSWTGVGRQFARPSKEDEPGPSRWRVDKDVLETFGVQLLGEARGQPFVVLDELGFMEGKAPRFVHGVCELFAECEKLLAVIQARALPFWLARIPRGTIDAHIEKSYHLNDPCMKELSGFFEGQP